jgi:hypothetical protein
MRSVPYAIWHELARSPQAGPSVHSMVAAAKEYRNDVVRLADLTVNSSTIDGITFVGCQILGPAVLVPISSTIVGCTWDAPDVNALFWEIASDRPVVVGAIAAVGCTFSSCKFSEVGLAGGRDLREQFVSDVG